MSSVTDTARASSGGRRPLADRTSATPSQLGTWLRQMLLIREFEVRTMQAYQDKKIGGFCHIYIGQEAVAVGCTGAVKPEDPIVTAYRDHGHALARGMDPKYCMAEMFGRIGGCAKGKGGSMHMFDKPNNLFGGHGIVGAQTPLGTGLAFGTKYIDEVINGEANRHVTLCFLGDGALNQGAFYEAMNLASLFDIPVIFVVENNGYSMGTSIDRGTSMAHRIIAKGEGCGIAGHELEGMDVIDVYEGMKTIADGCRAESRPAMVDIRTYRFKGHSMSDPRKYGTREEEEQWESDDPITLLRDAMYEAGLLDEAGFKALGKEQKLLVRESIAWAEASPEPPIEELHTDVYVERFGPYLGTSMPQIVTDAEENR